MAWIGAVTIQASVPIQSLFAMSGIKPPSGTLHLVQPLNSELEQRTPDYWRTRALEAREAAVQISDELSRRTLENIANSYDKLADWADRRRPVNRHRR